MMEILTLDLVDVEVEAKSKSVSDVTVKEMGRESSF